MGPAAVFLGTGAVSLRVPGVALLSFIFIISTIVGFRGYLGKIKIVFWVLLFVDILVSSLFYYRVIPGQDTPEAPEGRGFVETVYFYTSVVVGSSNIPLLLIA